MKKIIKSFFLSLFLWLLFLWFSNAQNLEVNDYLNNEDKELSNENFVSNWRTTYKDFSITPWASNYCTCAINIIEYFLLIYLILIWIILWILLIVLRVKAVKFDNTKTHTLLYYIPILNLYTPFKITIWGTRFLCICILLWFFSYSLYQSINRDRRCCPNPSWQEYTWFIVWILAIIILLVLISKFSKINKNDSNKETSKE